MSKMCHRCVRDGCVDGIGWFQDVFVMGTLQMLQDRMIGVCLCVGDMST